MNRSTIGKYGALASSLIPTGNFAVKRCGCIVTYIGDNRHIRLDSLRNHLRAAKANLFLNRIHYI